LGEGRGLNSTPQKKKPVVWPWIRKYLVKISFLGDWILEAELDRDLKRLHNIFNPAINEARKAKKYEEAETLDTSGIKSADLPPTLLMNINRTNSSGRRGSTTYKCRQFLTARRKRRMKTGSEPLRRMNGF
jgi:hypothetical protein